MSRSLDHDVQGVRFFESPEPARLGARAFARKREVHFAPGEFDLDTADGRGVVGHELAHVVQQSRGRVRTTGQVAGVPLNDDPALEQDADRLGRRAAAKAPGSRGLQEGAVAPGPVSDGLAPVGHARAGSSTPAQMNGFGDMWRSFKERHIRGPHQHDFFHPVLPDTPGNTSSLTEDLMQHPVPGRGTASPEGNTNFAFPVGWVRSTSDPSSRSITNTTIPRWHLLHPGTVHRSVESQGGQVGIRTRGTGSGLFPSLNDAMAPYLWGGVAHGAKLRLDKDYATQWHEEREKAFEQHRLHSNF